MACGFISPAMEDLCEQVMLESSRGTRKQARRNFSFTNANLKKLKKENDH